jgi:hypothetical protein
MNLRPNKKKRRSVNSLELVHVIIVHIVELENFSYINAKSKIGKGRECTLVITLKPLAYKSIKLRTVFVCETGSLWCRGSLGVNFVFFVAL